MSSIGQNGHFFRKKAPKTLQTPYSVPFLIVLHQNKALYKFPQKGEVSHCRIYKRSRSGSVHDVWKKSKVEENQINDKLLHQSRKFHCEALGTLKMLWFPVLH